MPEDKNDNKVKDKNLTIAISQIEKEFGKGSIMKLGDDAMHVDVPTISTGALALDIALRFLLGERVLQPSR